MDDGDFQNTNSHKLTTLMDDRKTIVHVEQERLTYVKKLTNGVDRNSKAIKVIANSLKDTPLEFRNTNFTISN